MPPSRQYVALLRGINVGGRAVVKMGALKEAFESFGLTEVRTYIQSGNVLFETKEADRDKLARGLEAHVKRVLRHQVTVFIVSPEELEDAAAHNPFEPQRLDKVQRCHLMFLSGRPQHANQEALIALQGREYRFHVRGKVMYFTYSRSLEGRRRTINFEKVLGVAGTARSWKVVDDLIRLSRQSAVRTKQA